MSSSFVTTIPKQFGGTHGLEDFQLKYLTTSWISKASIVCLLLLAITILVQVLTFRRRRSFLPPGPFPWPVVGSLFLLRFPIHQSFDQIAKQFGSIVYMWIGNASIVLLSSPDMAKELYTIRDLQFASRPREQFLKTTMKYWGFGGNGLAFGDYTSKVKIMHQICHTELFTMKRLNVSMALRKREISKAMTSIKKPLEHGNLVELRPILKDLSFNCSIQLFCGKAFKNMNTLEREEMMQKGKFVFNKLTDIIPKINLGDLFPMVSQFDFQGINKQWKTMHPQYEAFCASILDSYRKPNMVHQQIDTESYDLLETLLTIAMDHKLNDADIKGLFMDLMLGSTETIAAISEWVLLELARHPHILQKLQNELDTSVGDDKCIDGKNITDLPYFQAILKEAFRLHPPSPLLLTHVNDEDATLGNYTIPAKTSVFVNMWSIGHNVQTWGPNASEFNPDRFIGSKVGLLGTNFELLPFGAGRRICVGKGLAMTMLECTIASFTHAFDWAPPPNTHLGVDEGLHGLILLPQVPLVLKATPRKSMHNYIVTS